MTINNTSSLFEISTDNEFENIVKEIFRRSDINIFDFPRIVSTLDDKVLNYIENRLKENDLPDFEKILLLILLFINYKNKGKDEFLQLLRLLKTNFLDLEKFKNEKYKCIVSQIISISLVWGKKFYEKDDNIQSQIRSFLNDYIDFLNYLLTRKFYLENEPLFLYWLYNPLIKLYSKSLLPDEEVVTKFISLTQNLFNFSLEIDCDMSRLILDEIKKCKNLVDPNKLSQMIENVGDCYFKIGEKEEGIKGYYFLNIALNFYEKINNIEKIDKTKILISKKTEEIKTKEIMLSLPEEVLMKLKEEYNRLEAKIKELSNKKDYFKALLYITNEFILPQRSMLDQATEESSPIVYSLALITPFTEGRAGFIPDQQEAKKLWKSQLFQYVVFFYTMNKFIPLLNMFIDNLGKEKFIEYILDIYKKSLIFEPERNKIVREILRMFTAKNYLTFNYLLIPNLEHMFKIFFLKLGINIFDRKVFTLESVPLNVLLKDDKRKEIIEKYFGENFYDLLWLIFVYEYGLNIRNALMHGEGLLYLNEYYSYLMFFVFLYLILYTQIIK